MELPPKYSALNPEVLGADDETRTRDPHLGKVMRYQLRYIRMRSTLSALNARTNLIRILAAVTNRHVTATFTGLCANYADAICPATHLPLDVTWPGVSIILDDQPIRYFRAWRVISLLVRSYGSVEERSVHTGKVAGSIPARTTRKAPGWKQPGAFCVCTLNADIGICGFGPWKSPGRVSGPGVNADIGV